MVAGCLEIATGMPLAFSRQYLTVNFSSQIAVGKLGTHSIPKGAATFAKCNGIPWDWIQQHGWWRGQQRQVDTLTIYSHIQMPLLQQPSVEFVALANMSSKMDRMQVMTS